MLKSPVSTYRCPNASSSRHFRPAVTTAIALACGAFAAPPTATAAPQSHSVTVVQPQTYILELPPSTEVVLDPTIRAGETTELLAGTFGQIRVILNDGTFTQQVLVEPQPRVIRVGTKDSGYFDRHDLRCLLRGWDERAKILLRFVGLPHRWIRTTLRSVTCGITEV